MLNDAVFERNQIVEEKFNIQLEWFDRGSASALSKTLKDDVLSGSAECDIILHSALTAMTDGLSGLLMDMNKLPHIDLDKPWWNSQLRERTSLLDTNYFYVCDMNVGTWTQSYVTYFSKQIAENYKVENLYDTVREGKWTLEKLDTLTRGIYEDLNGNSQYDENDLYGLADCSCIIDCLLVSSGLSLTAKTEDEGMEVAISEQFYQVYDQIANLLQAPEMLYTDRPEYTAKRDVYDRGAFIDNRALFFIEGLYVGGTKLRDMQTEYGILPLPKFDETQENYYTYSHSSHNSTVSLPVTSAQKSDMLCMILEDMAYYSMDLIRPAYYEKTLTGKIALDDDSVEMLEIITQSTVYEPAFLLLSNNLTNGGSGLRAAISNAKPAASFIESVLEANNKILADAIEAVRVNQSAE
ncbi:MAG: hypothetical protein IJ493_08305 [Clostridia bacterium]|nr:hypothetical protein [Clostridia bacterium]